jgi:hypothetical protein
VEYETIYTNLFIARNTHSLYELAFIAYRRKRGHEPAVAIIALSHIVCGRAFYKETGVLKDVLSHVSYNTMLRDCYTYLHSFNGQGMEIGLLFVQSGKTIGWRIWDSLRSLEVGFNIEVGVSVLLIQPSAFFDDLLDLSDTCFFSLLVGCERIDSRDRSPRRVCGGTFRVHIVG